MSLLHHVTYAAPDRPEVEVWVDGAWHYGQLRMWSRTEPGRWLAQVTWSSGPGENRIDTFPAERVRKLLVCVTE